ncbi:helicase associated domain-containing protein [Streptomyces sp. NPDC046939]|uniref:helicase associated domain-containing protein n=1 Tax=Streptomyces sp. NPDC046939 TaxID=3155376 RepID=UPI0033D7A088
MRIRDRLGVVFSDEEFREAFGDRGRPGISPGQLALVSVLRCLENLTDRQAAHAAREGHLNVPRKHVEELPLEARTCRHRTRDHTGGHRPRRSVDLRMWTANVRRRANKLADQRRAALDQLGMRWWGAALIT